ncbi:MAG: Uma2 family endonuclease [Stigonema ocellatum SAG 48.90 = DSM 106950]|nr:Uma2 family endonuclease [Stigonema ocellatum SAG 48.90 = DSM 106950]
MRPKLLQNPLAFRHGECQSEELNDVEEISITNSVDWEIYESLLLKLEDNCHYRITYLDGILEIVSPSFRDEELKKRLGFLLELYLVRNRIKHTPMGSPTIKNKLKKAGAEPDECYSIGEKKDIPDLAIEVIITSGSINKLVTYRRLGVPEVWFWENNQLSLYHLREETPTNFLSAYGYEKVTRSILLPELNISLLEDCALITDHMQAVEEFEKVIN